MDKMCLIQLQVIEYKMNNKMIDGKVMTHAKNAQVLQADQYGSRKNHKSINCCLNKQIAANINYQPRYPLFIVSNNTK